MPFCWAGLGNLVTGLVGAGYTGSYIFSQTLFAMRAGVATRLHSWIIAAMELGMFVLPFSVRTRADRTFDSDVTPRAHTQTQAVVATVDLFPPLVLSF